MCHGALHRDICYITEKQEIFLCLEGKNLQYQIEESILLKRPCPFLNELKMDSLYDNT